GLEKSRLEAVLEELVEEGPVPQWDPLLAPVLAEYALGLYTRDRVEEARRVAERALTLAEGGEEEELARSIVEGDVTVDRRSAVVLGALLPESGSPVQQEYATLIRQGVEARLRAGREGRTIPAELEVRDDSGTVSGTSTLLTGLADLGTVGIVGPLGNETLAAAAEARARPVPIISPTAQDVPEDAPSVYSLNSRDPGAALALARFAASQGVRTALILHAGTPKHTYEAETFEDEYERLGGTVLRRLSYPPGSTFFEEPLDTVRQVLPEAVLLPVPVGDIELIAPQLTYFGLDTLGVRILGTEEWGEPEVVTSTEPRHLNGVVVATPRPPSGDMPGWNDFVEDYEEVHRQTLRSRIPALGYDAAGLLLEAVALGAREPEEVPRALREIEAYPGATGFLSVEDDRILRRYYLMRLRDREIIPIDLEELAPGSGAAPELEERGAVPGGPLP
ncbi:MAG: ABC transporter substrate-binding protein, partial [Gemmatimonadota bacterium]